LAAPSVAIIAVGSCATFGGVPAASPNPAQIIGVSEALKKTGIDKSLVNLDLCPVNVEMLTSVIVNYILLGKLPELDSFGRPKIFFGQPIHDNCERRAHFDAGRFVETFGTKEEALGYCLYKVGCKGPMTYSTCPKTRYNGKINWCIGAGGPCIGCAEPGWPDKFAGFYNRLPDVKGAGLEATADKIGAAAAVVTAAGIAVHALGSAASGRMKGKDDGGEK